MSRSIALLAVLSLVSFAGVGQMAVEPGHAASDGDWLQYDNGTYHWYTWGGTYRGTWFDIQDFIPSATSYIVSISELWFYHQSSHPWDTSDVYVELWNGDNMGPTALLDQTIMTAASLSPSYCIYSPSITTLQNFWCLANTELSAGGWPSILGDNSQATIAHSFFSDDFIVWEPWDLGGACYYLIRVAWLDSIDRTTWAGLKTSF
jgi:hypothetical protein